MKQLCSENDKKTDGLVPDLQDGDAKRLKMSVGDLKKMHSLDAFIKETIRMDMPGWCEGLPLLSPHHHQSFHSSIPRRDPELTRRGSSASFMRKSMQSFTLNSSPQSSSNPEEKNHLERIVVPTQTMVCISTAAMSRDPEYFSNPDTFDPSRFYTTRPNSSVQRRREAEVSAGQAGEGEKEGRETRDTAPEASFAGLDPCMPIWGLVRWSCPGRFYADLQIKLVVAEILMKWEVSLPEHGGVGRDNGTSAGSADKTRETKEMKRINTGDRIIPDPKQEVVFTRRD